MNQPKRSGSALKSRIVLRCFATVLLSAVFSAAAAQPEVCTGSKVKKALLDKYDSRAALPQSEITAAVAEHLPFGAPPCAKLLVLKWYVVCYDTQKRIPLWVAYSLSAQDIKKRVRKNAFRSDPRLTDEENARCADYKAVSKDYDRGHSAPNADFNRSAEAQADTYYFSNMSPQTKELNEHRWANLEDRVRDWAKKFGTVYVVTGPIFVGNEVHTVPSGRVAIPTEFFKIVLRKEDGGNLVAQTFVLPNGTGAHLALPSGPGTTAQKVDIYLLHHLASIDFVESMTGLNFFPDLPAAQQETLESNVPSALWPK